MCRDLEALFRLLGEFEDNPDSFCFGVTGFPSGLHLFYAELADLDTGFLLP